MDTTFIIKPTTYTAFENEAEQIDKCKEWGLLSDKAVKSKTFYYKGSGMNQACDIVGYVDHLTAVIQLSPEQLHCIHPSYLKEMQASTFGSRVSAATDKSNETEVETTSATEPQEPTQQAQESVATPAIDEPVATETSQAEEAEAPAKSKAKKGKAPKLELPEEKVKMTATVQEFTTVPNNFSDTDDEVIIYEAVAMIDPPLEIGVAWSSHSATLKKFELEVGDTITFDAKIIAKKLTKHPVPYKINNPAKIQKTTS
ncbi:hypothetical protein [Paenibacillus guangzhouensis]|uniref:hypothetical protein n=1 Tax=Paenibacillus guangzhouensis TaxID=1473112 RepID=UPI001266A21F|nr:hypothetical protein [Paenibacillus guangzhouensis]